MMRLFKDMVASDAHVPTALGNEGRKRKFRAFASAITMKPKTVEADKRDTSFTMSVPIAKVDDDQQMIWGWASVIEEGGAVVTDKHDDKIELTELSRAAHTFMKFYRVGGDMHDTMGTGEIVESIVFTPDVQKALGIDLKKVGWFIGYHVTDADVWKRVKSGDLKAFSFGGRARRVEA
jgi:Putative phage serine protease XkdF